MSSSAADNSEVSHKRSVLMVAGGTDDEARSALGVALELASLDVHVTLLAPERYRRLAVDTAKVRRFIALDLDAAAMVWSSSPSVRVDEAWVQSVAVKLDAHVDRHLEELWAQTSQAAWLDADSSSSSSSSQWRVSAVVSCSLRVLTALAGIVAERLSVPLLVLQYAPLTPSAHLSHPYAPPFLPDALLSLLSARQRHRLSHALVAYLSRDADLRFDALRDNLGLHAISSRGLLANAHVECTWSAPLLERPEDWPLHVRLSGLPAPLHDESKRVSSLKALHERLQHVGLAWSFNQSTTAPTPFLLFSLEACPAALWRDCAQSVRVGCINCGVKVAIVLLSEEDEASAALAADALNALHPAASLHLLVLPVASAAHLRRPLLAGSSTMVCIGIVHEGALSAHRDCWLNPSGPVPSLPVPLFDDQRFWALHLSASSLTLAPFALATLGDDKAWTKALSVLLSDRDRLVQAMRLWLSRSRFALSGSLERSVALKTWSLSRGLHDPSQSAPAFPAHWIGPTAQRWLTRGAIVAGVVGAARLYAEVAYVLPLDEST